jgi:hypothetical protein
LENRPLGLAKPNSPCSSCVYKPVNTSASNWPNAGFLPRLAMTLIEPVPALPTDALPAPGVTWKFAAPLMTSALTNWLVKASV